MDWAACPRSVASCSPNWLSSTIPTTHPSKAASESFKEEGLWSNCCWPGWWKPVFDAKDLQAFCISHVQEHTPSIQCFTPYYTFIGLRQSNGMSSQRCLPLINSKREILMITRPAIIHSGSVDQPPALRRSWLIRWIWVCWSHAWYTWSRQILYVNYSSVLMFLYSQGRILNPLSMALLICFLSFQDIRSHPRGQVRLQTRALDGPKGLSSTFIHILRCEGVRGLYNGVRLPKVPASSLMMSLPIFNPI